MRSYHNDIDDFMQFALYILPKYMRRFERYNAEYDDRKPGYNLKSHHHDHHGGIFGESPIDRKKLIEFLEKNFWEDGKAFSKNKKDEIKSDKKKDGSDKLDKVVDKAIDASFVEDSKESKTEGKKTEDKAVNKTEDAGQKNENDKNCIGKFLSGFYGECVDIGFKCLELTFLENISLIYSDCDILKVRDNENQIFVIPICNIAIIYFKNVVDSKNSYAGINASTDNYMEKYFVSKIGTKMDVRTTDKAKFKFIKDATVKNIYGGFVLFDNNMLVNMDSIIFIKEM